MRKPRRPIDDLEILELLQDEPELLAIVDAIAATQAPRRRRVRRRLLLVAVAAGVIVLALVPRQLGGEDLTDRALAAVGNGPVVHLVASRPEPERTVIDLATGSERVTTLRLETWFDSDTGETRTVTRRDGETVADTVTTSPRGSPPPAGGLDPVVSIFVRGYRAALGAGELVVLRRTRLDGSEVVWVRLRLPQGRTDEVALEAATDLPRAFRFVVGTEPASPLWRVDAIDSKPRSETDFTPTTSPTGPARGEIESERPASTTEAATVLRGRGRWPGRLVEGLGLTRISAQVLSRTFVNGRREETSGVELLYGDSAGRFVQIRQATSPEVAYGFAEGRFVLGFAPIPAPGLLALTSSGQGGDSRWRGQVRAGDAYLTILASSRHLVLETARTLEPLR